MYALLTEIIILSQFFLNYHHSYTEMFISLKCFWLCVWLCVWSRWFVYMVVMCLVTCLVTCRGRSIQLPINTMKLSKTKLRRLAHFKNFHIKKFLDSRTTILTSRTAKMADSVEGIQRCHRWAENPLERKSTKRHQKSLETTMAAAAHAQEKAKSKGEKTYK